MQGGDLEDDEILSIFGRRGKYQGQTMKNLSTKILYIFSYKIFIKFMNIWTMHFGFFLISSGRDLVEFFILLNNFKIDIFYKFIFLILTHHLYIIRLFTFFYSINLYKYKIYHIREYYYYTIIMKLKFTFIFFLF